jgi:hypothetical protein
MAAGNHARALEVADTTRSELDTVTDPYAQASLLAPIATFGAMAGRVEQARADAARALELARVSQNVAAISGALQGTTWALQRDDPAAALAAAEEYLQLYREFDVGIGAATGMMALAGGIRARLGEDAGALVILHESITLGRDQGVRPQLAAALDFALTPLLRTGRPEVAATFLGALTLGSLADVGEFPGVAAARSRSLERVRDRLGDETDAHVSRGAAMSYDELTEYAMRELDLG